MNGWQLCKPCHTVFFNKEAYGYPDNYKRRQKMQKHRALAKNIFFQDSLYLFPFEQ